MELIQIFDRQLGQWSPRYKLRVGYKENWVQDKTTDTGKDFVFDIYQEDAPTWGITDWVRVMHVDAPEEAATYTSEGLPTNHGQYIIGGISCTQNKKLGKWTVTLALAEPIERTRGIIGETLTFTNQTTKTVQINPQTSVTYVKEPYNHYTALRRWLMVTPANCDRYEDDDFTPIKLGQPRGVLPGDSLGVLELQGTPQYFDYVVGGAHIIEFGDGSYLTSIQIGSTAQQVQHRSSTNSVIATIGGYNLLEGVWAWSVPSYDFGRRTVSGIQQDYVRGALIVESKNVSWHNRITVLDKDWLATISFADTTYNELSLYNVLMDNYDSSTGRTPVMYFDMNPATDLPRVIARDEYLLKFERQDGFDKPVLDWDELTHKAMDITLTQAASNYATGLVSNITNLSTGRAVEFPALSLYAVPEVLDDTVRATWGVSYNAPGDNWGIKLPHKVKKVTKVLRLDIFGQFRFNPTGNRLTTLRRRTTPETETLPNIYEKKQYLSAVTPPKSNNAAMWYEEGGNVLHLRGYFNDAEGSEGGGGDGNTAIYYIEYEPLIDCRIELGDVGFAQQINQSSSQVGAGKFASFMGNYLDGMNKADVVFGKTYYDFADFANHIGCRVRRGGKTYLITNVSYINRNLQYDAFYQLNEHHIRKNASYQASQEIRPNIDIATDNIKERMSYIKQTIRVGVTPQTAEGNQFLTDKRVAMSGLAPGMVETDKYPQVALVGAKSLLKLSGGGETELSESRLGYIARFIFGTQAIFEIRMIDNAIAGKQKKAGLLRMGADAFPRMYDVVSQTPVLYTDFFGEVQRLSLVFSSFTTNPLADVDYPETTETVGGAHPVYDALLATDTVYRSIAELPIVYEEALTQIIANKALDLYAINLYKDQLEGCNVACAIDYVSGDAKTIVCDGLPETSRLMMQHDLGETGYFAISFYANNKSPDDTTDGAASTRYATASIFGDGCLDLQLNDIVDVDYKSIVVYNYHTTIDKKMLIINDVDATIKAQTSSGKLRIYFA